MYIPGATFVSKNYVQWLFEHVLKYIRKYEVQIRRCSFECFSNFEPLCCAQSLRAFGMK